MEYLVPVTVEKLKSASEGLGMAAGFIEGLADNKQRNNAKFAAFLRATARDLVVDVKDGE